MIRRRVRYRVATGGALFLLALLLVGAGAFFSGNNLLFLIFAAMMALLLVSGFLSRLVLAGLELELLLPPHVFARTPTPARIRVRNLKRLTPSFSIELSGERSFLPQPVYLPLIPGHATIEMPVEVVFPRRGRHSENLFLLSTTFPFGFISRTSPVELIRETIVYPAPASGEATRALAESTAAEAGYVRGTGNEFHRIRAYEPSDEARHVDWKGTARTGAVQVREFARDRKRTVEVLFDTRISAGQEKQFEDLVEQCAAVCRHLASINNPILFLCEETSIDASTADRIYDILILLALVDPVIQTAVPAADLHAGNESVVRIVFSTRTGQMKQEIV